MSKVQKVASEPSQTESAMTKPIESAPQPQQERTAACEDCNAPIWKVDENLWSHYGGYPDHEAKPAPSQPQPAESDGFEERIANLENGLKIAKEHRDNAIRRAEVQEMRARRAEAIVETYNKTGFADSDRMAEEYLKAMERAEAAEAKLQSLLAQKPEVKVSDDEETRRAIAEDRAFLHGMESGWNLGVEEDREEFNRRLEAGYTSIREASRELKAKDAEKGQGK